MGFLKSLFKFNTPPGETTYKIVEKHLSIDEHRYQVRIKKAGREFYVEELFQNAKNPRDLKFGRFFLVNENPPKPHFAPSLNQAVEWFMGRSQPKDGYETIFWGDQVVYECSVCRARRAMPLRITQVEHLTVARAIPTPLSIDGWRVVEVESELVGKGTPTRRLEDHKLKAIIIWHKAPNQYLCRGCAEKLTAAGQPPDPAACIIFAAE
jgi:hypothetical protein